MGGISCMMPLCHSTLARGAAIVAAAAPIAARARSRAVPAAICRGEAARVRHRGLERHATTICYDAFSVCTNSLIARDRFKEVRVHHKGDVRDEIIGGIYTVANDFPRLVDASRAMAAVQLTRDEQRVFAEAALVARYGEEEPSVTPEQAPAPRRAADIDPSLRTTFNVAQEISSAVA